MISPVPPPEAIPSATTLSRTLGFDLLEDALAREVQLTLCSGLKDGVVFADGSTPLAIFRHAVKTAIGRVHDDGRAPLFLRFLKNGPYEDVGDIPMALRARRLTDKETTAAIAFIFSHMVNCFKGALAELLAVGPCLHILRQLQAEKRLPREARLYAGDAVRAAPLKRTGFAKGADLHILTLGSPASNSTIRGRLVRQPPSPGFGGPRECPTYSVAIGGIAEVKSYFQSEEGLRLQLKQHLARSGRGLRVGEDVYSGDQIRAGRDSGGQAARIAVVPARWTLPRSFRFKTRRGRRFLHVDPPVPPEGSDTIERVGPSDWRVTLRWSKEALDAAGYSMTFWFMEKVGEALFAVGVPEEWQPMTPAEAGQNAAKQSLYYAILRCPIGSRAEQRAIALYNSYGFGCALGMNFRNAEGRREMLWPQDLEEVLACGQTKSGCRIV